MSNLVLWILKFCNQPTETGFNWPTGFLQDFKVSSYRMTQKYRIIGHFFPKYRTNIGHFFPKYRTK